ncbi:energy transducer TonB [Laspinema olomoucense]|uniref:Energy transducer TonB n=1 Tax=Laspinema olomoucense D3b TaxID=2953688 RepID=A0ABT2N1J1_9CYAN|nr:energy transducer TonB [Laspinema sp. D3b]MCT7976553.1 energy transducer TonB [Laspinema sp. D3b]
MSYSLPKNSLIDLLSQPTVVAILASVGIHGLLGISWDRLPLKGETEPNPWTTVDLVNLTPEEVSRLPDLSSPQATGSGSLNSSSEPVAGLPELGPLPPSPGKLGLEPLTLPPGNPLYDLPLDLPPAPSLRDLKTPLPSLQDYQSPTELREGLRNGQSSGSSNSMAIEQLLALERLERAQIEREIEQRERQQRQSAEQNRLIPPPPPQEFRLQDVPPPPQGSFPASGNQQRPFSGMNEAVDASEFADIPIPENVPGPEAIARAENGNPTPPPGFSPSGTLPGDVNPGMGPAPTGPQSQQIGRAVDLQTAPRNSQQDGIEEGAQAVGPSNAPTPSDRPQEGAAVPDKVGTDPERVRELWAKIIGENRGEDNPENPTGLVSDRQNAMLEGVEAYAQWVANLESQYGEVRTNTAIGVANQYPLEACPQKLQGRALFGVLVNPDGQIMDGPRRLLGSGQDILDSFARKFVQDMKFAPVSKPTVYQYAFEFQYAPQLCTNAPSPGTNPTPPVETQQPEVNNTQPPAGNVPPVLDAESPAENVPPVLDAESPAENVPPVLDGEPRGENSPLRMEQPPASRPQQLRDPSPEGEPAKPVNVAPQPKPAPGPVPGEARQEPAAPVEAVEPKPVQESVPQQVQPQNEPSQPVETPEMGEEDGLTPQGLQTPPTGDSQELATPETSEAEPGEPVEVDNPESEPAEDAAQMEEESPEAIADEEERDPEI